VGNSCGTAAALPRIAARWPAAALVRAAAAPPARASRCLSSGSGGDRDPSPALGLPEPNEDATAAETGGSQALGRVGGVKTPGAKMSMTFTCDVCETRSTKIFHRQSYEKGTVIVRCPGCESLHLVADNLGWFLDGPEGYNIESILASKGQSVRRAADRDEDSAAEFLPDDVFFADEKQWAATGDERGGNRPDTAITEATAGVAPATEASAPEASAVQPHTHEDACADGRTVGRVTLEELFAVIDGMELSDARR
jgi:protein import protein ZIM17